jgi:hypothetical protein
MKNKFMSNLLFVSVILFVGYLFCIATSEFMSNYSKSRAKIEYDLCLGLTVDSSKCFYKGEK